MWLMDQPSADLNNERDEGMLWTKKRIRDRAQWSTARLLHELDERRILYAPTASRADLEDLLLEALSNDKYHGSSPCCTDSDEYSSGGTNCCDGINAANTEVHAPSSELILQERLQRRDRRRTRQQRIDELQEANILSPSSTLSSWSRAVANGVPKVAGTLLDRAARKARRIQRKAVEFWAIDDETGVRDARYQYLQRRRPFRRSYPSSGSSSSTEPPVEVVVVQGGSGNGDRPAAQPRRPTTSGNSMDQFRTKPLSPPYQPQRIRRSDVFPTVLDPRDRSNESQSPHPQTTASRPARMRDALTENALLLPSFNARSEATAPSINRQRHRIIQATPANSTNESDDISSQPPLAQKRVYSPYAATSSNSGFDTEPDGSNEFLDRDVVDKVAEFLADAADKVMWGRFDQMYSTEPRRKSRSSSNSGTAQGKQRARFRAPQQHPRHWKDRLEESLDSMLGLHEDGSFYSRWADQFNQDNSASESGEPNDAFAVARGRRQKAVGHRRKGYDKPFWEEEGNVFALLFGRTQSGKDLFFENRLDFRSGGSLLFFLRGAARSFLIVASYLCRWASTQGALPQPVVVMGVGAAALCAAPRRRITTVVITLLLLRTVGEVLHSYAYGADGWDTRQRDDDDEDDQDKSDEYDGSAGIS